MYEAKLKEVFSDKAYVESIAKLSAEDAAKSLAEKGIEVTAEDLTKLHDFMVAHKEELQNGELSEDALSNVAGGMSTEAIVLTTVVATIDALAVLVACLW